MNWLLCLTVALVLSFAPNASAFVDRKAWIFEQLATPPLATLKNESRYQASVQATNYRDALSTQASGVLELREFEIGLKGSQRFFPALTQEGADLRNALSPQATAFSLEVARHFVTEGGAYGRLGAEIFQFLPTSKRALKLGLSTGNLEAANHWSLQVQTNFFLFFPAEENFLLVRLESVKRVTAGKDSSLQLGGILSWANRMKDLSAVGVHEYMLFSFGPLVVWSSPLGNLRLNIAARLWLDQEVVKPGDKFNGHPMDVSPAATLSWTKPL